MSLLKRETPPGSGAAFREGLRMLSERPDQDQGMQPKPARKFDQPKL